MPRFIARSVVIIKLPMILNDRFFKDENRKVFERS